MRALAVGDSFTYGEELTNRTMAWPNILANKLGYIFTNLGNPGASNTRISRLIIEQLNNYDIVIIAWSHYARTEMADDYGLYDIWPGNSGRVYYNKHSWRQDVIKYITDHHNDNYLYRQHLLNIILIQHYLKSNNKKYIMLDAFGNYRDNKHAITNLDLIAQIDATYYVGWLESTMMEWTWLVDRGPGGHFLEEGHAIVADKIYEHIRNLGWVS